MSIRFLSQLLALVALSCLAPSSTAFAPQYFSSANRQGLKLYSSSPVTNSAELEILNAGEATDEWELDCYSRPVVINGKKLWEVLISDSAGSFRYRHELPSNQVNSKMLRKVVDDLIENDAIEVKPNIIRFFRGAMFNMVRKKSLSCRSVEFVFLDGLSVFAYVCVCVCIL